MTDTQPLSADPTLYDLIPDATNKEQTMLAVMEWARKREAAARAAGRAENAALREAILDIASGIESESLRAKLRALAADKDAS